MIHKSDTQLATQRQWLTYLPLILALIAILGALLIYNPKKIYWFDEAYTAQVLTSDSFSTVWAVITDDYDVVPPFYYFLGFAWTKVMGGSDLSLRLFTALGIMVSVTCVWYMLRRTYDILSSSVGTFGVLLLSYQIFRQIAEARFYGLYLALTALALLSYDRYTRQEKPPFWLYVVTALVHGALVTTHFVGFFYSAAILLSLLIMDWQAKQFRLRVYLPIVIGWMAFVPWLPIILHQIQNVRGYTWILPPTITRLFVTYTVGLSLDLVPVFLLMLGVLWLVLRRMRHNSDAQVALRGMRVQERHLFIVALLFAAMPLVIWIVSNSLVSLYVERYMLPSLLGFAILLSMICYRLSWFVSAYRSSSRQDIDSKIVNTTMVGLVTISLVSPIVWTLIQNPDLLPDDQIAPYNADNLSIVIEDPLQYLSQARYASHPELYVYVADQMAVYDSRSKIHDRAGEALLIGLHRHYPELNIVPTADFLAAHDRFLVLDWDESSWAEIRVEENENYNTTVLNPGEAEPLVLLVTHKTTAETP